MNNNGLFSSLFIDDLKKRVTLDDAARGRMATLSHKWRARNTGHSEALWESFLKQALAYLEFVPSVQPAAPGVYPLYEDWGFSECVAVLYLAPPGSDMGDTSVGRFYPAKLLAQLKVRELNWGMLTDGSRWRLYSTKSAKPYEDYVELFLAETLKGADEKEYGLFERFFHKDSFVADSSLNAAAQARDLEGAEETGQQEAATPLKCRLDQDREQSERALEERVKKPFLAQVDEVLQYICNGFIFDTRKSGEEYSEEERAEIFESAVKLIYRCLFLFYAEARRLLPTDAEKADLYRRHSTRALCLEARKFRWGKRRDIDQYDLWKHLKGLVSAVNNGDPEYGIMGYNGGLFDDEEEPFLGRHQLRNDFLSRALYLLAFVEPLNDEPDGEYPIPYEDLEVRHLGELYETILEYTVQLADADRFRRRTKKGVEILLASQATKRAGDTLIKKGDVYFGESALERKQTGSFYTPESLVRFLNEKTVVEPLRETFERKYRQRFEQLLEQAKKSHDVGTRRGAAQSAAQLVERFVREDVLPFKVCDPAMGSGHFLVDAANQMTGLVIALLAEVPRVDGLTVSVSSAPNDWRRQITRYCLYGVDLNPLAVNLAKLSLWLNCFASQHRLTFLDHHLRRGNSLIGVRSFQQLASIPKRKGDNQNGNKTQEALFDFNDLSASLETAAKGVASITRIDEDDTDSQKALLDEALGTTLRLHPLADLYTAYLMNTVISPGSYKEVFELLATGKSVTETTTPLWQAVGALAQVHRLLHHFFHWPLEFPDVFGTGTAGGFSATVGNPPWDTVMLNSQEFFSRYDPAFRSYDKQKASQVSTKLMGDNPRIAEKWKRYGAAFVEQNTYFKEPLAYGTVGSGHINTFGLFLEQCFDVLREGGRMGIVVPSGIYTDQGCQPLRELFFGHSRIDFLYCFENRRAVFNIHRSFKFVLFGTEKGVSTDQFKCAFMEHDPERLQAIDIGALRLNVDQTRRFSPDTLSVMEFKSQRDIEVTTKIYADWPLLGHEVSGTWNAVFQRELNMTDDSHLFRSGPTDCPLYEGKMVWLLDSHFGSPRFWLDRSEVRKTRGEDAWEGEHFRVVFRSVAASTNERTLIASVVPPSWTGHSLQTVIPKRDGGESNGPNEVEGMWLAAFLASFCGDYVILQKVTNNVSHFYMQSMPIPRLPGGAIRRSFGGLVARAARLLCDGREFKSLWEKAFSVEWRSPTSWYPSSAPIDAYGPGHEQEIRRRLRDEAQRLTPEWGPHCGVHERLPDRRDTGDRAQLRAEIDAYVAHLYGLSRADFAYILDTFPVLRKKEEKAFGEFMSRRKCLEEYDRLAVVLGKQS